MTGNELVPTPSGLRQRFPLIISDELVPGVIFSEAVSRIKPRSLSLQDWRGGRSSNPYFDLCFTVRVIIFLRMSMFMSAKVFI